VTTFQAKQAGATSNGVVENASLMGADGNPFTLAEEFVVIEREPIVAYLDSHDGRTTMLARGLTLNIGGPSDASKSLAMIDLLGKLSSVGAEDWLGLKVTAEQLRVGLVVYPGEGEDEDLVGRVRQLVPAGAQLYVWDRWRKTEAPRATADGIRSWRGSQASWRFTSSRLTPTRRSSAAGMTARTASQRTRTTR
jgi:hypothetical protein